jgi:hypothetical protein
MPSPLIAVEAGFPLVLLLWYRIEQSELTGLYRVDGYA